MAGASQAATADPKGWLTLDDKMGILRVTLRRPVYGAPSRPQIRQPSWRAIRVSGNPDYEANSPIPANTLSLRLWGLQPFTL